LEKSIDIANQLFKNSRADYLEVLLNQRDAWMPKWNWLKQNKTAEYSCRYLQELRRRLEVICKSLMFYFGDRLIGGLFCCIKEK
jgi:hypothetical protein